MTDPDKIRLRLHRLSKSFPSGGETLSILNEVSLELARGDAIAVTGPSGSGKSTLLHIIGTLDNPSSGSVTIDGSDPFQLSNNRLAHFRNEVIGFVFQDHHLLPQYNVLENVLLPTLAFPGDKKAKEARAKMLLERVKLDHRLQHRPARLSGGERQRVAIARALINQPSVLLCDEPTGNLDQDTADQIASLLFELRNEQETVMIVVTHSLELARRLPRRFELRGGNLHEATP